MKKINFAQITLQELEELFDLKRVKSSQQKELQDWISSSETISELEQQVLSHLRDSLVDRIEAWNEQELILKFIGPIISLVGFDTEDFTLFANRPLTAQIDDTELAGMVDAMIATGWQTPRKPYFCFHEYKKEQGRENDPGGQVLAAMLAARQLNENKCPVYGAYVLGRNWFFLVLEGNEYSISNAFIATCDEIYEIMKILKNLKSRIVSQIKK